MLLRLVQLLLGIGLEGDLTNLRQVVGLRALGRRVVRLQAAKWGSAAGAVPAAAIDSLALLRQNTCSGRVANDGAAFIHLAPQMLVRTVQPTAVQSLICVLTRMGLLLCLIQDVLRALSFDDLALHFLNV